MDDLVCIREYSIRTDAMLDKALLEANNIAAIITGGDAGGAFPYPFSPSATGIKLLVYKKDIEKAAALLKQENKE